MRGFFVNPFFASPCLPLFPSVFCILTFSVFLELAFGSITDNSLSYLILSAVTKGRFYESNFTTHTNDTDTAIPKNKSHTREQPVPGLLTFIPRPTKMIKFDKEKIWEKNLKRS